jgi:hypothetical protein
MVGAAVLGAVTANVLGWFVANAARECSYFAHKIYFA